MVETVRIDLPELIRRSAEPLPEIDDDRFGAFFDRFGDARVVLLGEASHGTSEFYRARAQISKRLIAHHGFNIVAVANRTFRNQVRIRESGVRGQESGTHSDCIG